MNAWMQLLLYPLALFLGPPPPNGTTQALYNPINNYAPYVKLTSTDITISHQHVVPKQCALIGISFLACLLGTCKSAARLCVSQPVIELGSFALVESKCVNPMIFFMSSSSSVSGTGSSSSSFSFSLWCDHSCSRGDLFAQSHGYTASLSNRQSLVLHCCTLGSIILWSLTLYNCMHNEAWSRQ